MAVRRVPRLDYQVGGDRYALSPFTVRAIYQRPDHIHRLRAAPRLIARLLQPTAS
jgi:hypothetical protein